MAAPAGQYHIVTDQGATFTRQLTWKDDTGAAVNLTGYTARMQLRTSVQNDSVVLELTDANGRIALGGAAGTITLTVTAADMTTLPPLKYVYDLELVNGTVVTRLVQGTFIVRPEVTR
jgi:hypothetical protein